MTSSVQLAYQVEEEMPHDKTEDGSYNRRNIYSGQVQKVKVIGGYNENGDGCVVGDGPRN